MESRRPFRRQDRRGLTDGAWSLGSITSAIYGIWTRATNGITVGTQGSIPADLTTWTVAGATPTASGSDFVLTANAGAGAHEITVTPTTSVAGPMAVTFEVLAGTVGHLYIASGATLIGWINLATGAAGTHAGTTYRDCIVTPLGAGRFRVTLLFTYVATETIRIGLSAADNTPTYVAAGTETATIRAVASFSLAGALPVVQQRISAWADLRGTGAAWVQATAALQPLLWYDAKGPAVVGAGAQYMTADTLAAGFSGTSKPFWMATAIDAVPRNATSRCEWSLGGGAGVLLLASEANFSATQTRASRWDDGGQETAIATTTGTTQGAMVDWYDGANRTISWGAATKTEAHAGLLNTTHATILGLRYGAGATLSELSMATMREIAMSPTLITGTQATRAAAYLKARYGY